MELHIENERLKTTLMILTKKLNMKEDEQRADITGRESHVKELTDRNKSL